MKIIIIAGSTGVGKTELSINLAKKYNGEIISADSMQIYKRMDIGTAKIKAEEMQGIPHHMIDIVEPYENFTAFDFMSRAENIIKEITSRGKVPIVVGGTGLYINTLLYEMDFNKVDADEEYRSSLWNFYNQNGTEALFEKLLAVDPNTKIEKENTKRVIRALEIYKTTGKIGKFDKMKKRKDILSKLYVLSRDREELYENINIRVDKMVAEGLIDEVKSLINEGLSLQHQSMKAIGYRQIIEYIEGKFTEKEAIEEIKKESRRYAKRQITWFKRYEDATWLDLTDTKIEKVIENIDF